jgi:hypothetical protein
VPESACWVASEAAVTAFHLVAAELVLAVAPPLFGCDGFALSSESLVCSFRQTSRPTVVVAEVVRNRESVNVVASRWDAASCVIVSSEG